MPGNSARNRFLKILTLNIFQNDFQKKFVLGTWKNYVNMIDVPKWITFIARNCLPENGGKLSWSRLYISGQSFRLLWWIWSHKFCKVLR
jgi:hypothetical protein